MRRREEEGGAEQRGPPPLLSGACWTRRKQALHMTSVPKGHHGATYGATTKGERGGRGGVRKTQIFWGLPRGSGSLSQRRPTTTIAQRRPTTTPDALGVRGSGIHIERV